MIVSKVIASFTKYVKTSVLKTCSNKLVIFNLMPVKRWEC